VTALVFGVAVGQDRPARQRGTGSADQAAPGGGQRGGAPGAGGDRQFDPAQMRQMMEQRTREQLGATEAEWKTLGPRVMKVEQLNRQLSGSRGGMFPGGRRGAEGGQEAEMTALEKASQALRTTLRNESASPDEIKKQLAAVRTAREAAKKELAVAQADLRKSVNIRQEAQLVLMGLLD
jgi:hypothetical protein